MSRFVFFSCVPTSSSAYVSSNMDKSAPILDLVVQWEDRCPSITNNFQKVQYCSKLVLFKFHKTESVSTTDLKILTVAIWKSDPKKTNNFFCDILCQFLAVSSIPSCEGCSCRVVQSYFSMRKFSHSKKYSLNQM